MLQALRSLECEQRSGGSFELALVPKDHHGCGQHAANPMLQETPDPITKVTWDNYVTMSHADVDAMGLNGFIGQEKLGKCCQVYVGRRTSWSSLSFP